MVGKKEAEAARLDVRVDPRREYEVKLTGGGINKLLGLTRNSPFKGEDAYLIVDILERLQAPILHEAHGAQPEADDEDDETKEPPRNGSGHDREDATHWAD